MSHGIPPDPLPANLEAALAALGLDRSAGAARTPLPPPERLGLNVDEAAAMLGVGRTTAYAAVRNGALPSIRIGKRIVIPRAAIERLLS